MKTLFRTMFVAAAVIMTAGCGNTSSKKTETVEVTVADPTVSVAQVFVREVPQEAVYTSTVQAYVKNNIAPQMAGRITKINVEIGDRVKISFNLSSREYNGRWYTDVRAWRIEPAGATGSYASPAQAGSYAAPTGTPLPTADDMSTPFSDDDLPF